MLLPRPRHLQPVPLVDLAEVVDSPKPVTDLPVHGLTLDSRTVQPGDLYAALPGARAHGADFAAQAAAAGAVAVLTDPDGASILTAAGIELPALVVPDPRGVLGRVAAAIYRTNPAGLTLIGVTGTNGKTTTAYLIDSALRALGQPPGLVGTVEIRVGDERIKSVRTTPEAPDLHALIATMRERGLSACVMEVSSHALTLHRVDGLVYDLALFTNLSQDHLDLHGTMADYYAAKASLFTPERARRGIVCVDDEWGVKLAAEAEIPITTLGSGADVDADYRLIADPDDPAGFRVRGADLELPLRSALPGTFNQVNTALAALALLAIGHPVEASAAAVLSDPHVPGRMERIEDPSGELLAVVDYAHTPDAVAAALAALRPSVTGALVVVVGAGGDRDRGKRAAMGAAAARGADVVVVTDDNPRSEDPAQIRAAVRAGADDAGAAAKVVELADRRAAIAAAVAAARSAGPGSIVAVVGKGHESGQEVGSVIHPFDDRVELGAALAAPGSSAS